MHIGGSVRPPAVIHSVAPSFTKEDAKGVRTHSAQVYFWVEEDGTPSHVRIVRSAGPAMDKKIITAVEQEHPPLRLPLGAFAYELMGAEIEAVRKEHASLERIARGADYPKER